MPHLSSIKIPPPRIAVNHMNGKKGKKKRKEKIKGNRGGRKVKKRELKYTFRRIVLVFLCYRNSRYSEFSYLYFFLSENRALT